MKEMIVRLLGGFEARTAGDATLSFPTKKTKALLAYLSVHPGKSHSRSELAGLPWGDSGGEQARASLRQTLSYLRKALMPTGQEHLVVQDDLVLTKDARGEDRQSRVLGPADLDAALEPVAAVDFEMIH